MLAPGYTSQRIRYPDRRAAGRALADELLHFRGRDDVLVLALPRGGVPVAYEVARALDAPLDVLCVRKLGYPGHDEFAMGAVASGGVRVRNESLSFEQGLSRALDETALRESEELTRREQAYRGGRPPLDLRNRVVILVDDGLATGSSMRAAIAAAHSQHPARLVVAIPTAPPQTCDELAAEVDELVCPSRPEPFSAVGLSYVDFDQTSDDEVRALLAVAPRSPAVAPTRTHH